MALASKQAAFRQVLPDLSIPRFTRAKEQDARSYAATFKAEKVPPWLYSLVETWQKLYQEPYKGVTSDGTVRQNLFKESDEGVQMGVIVDAVQNLMGKLSTEQREKVKYPMNASQWRSWSNPEFLLRPENGLRLEEVDEVAAKAILAVLEATLSPEGYHKALSAMRINHFLGELVELPRILNKYSYNFLLFGTPSTTQAWGWSFYGHHLCLSVFLKGTQIIVSPVFTGAEPNVIDVGEFSGTAIMNEEEQFGLQLMQSLKPELQTRAQIFKLMHDPGMQVTGDKATDRWNEDDQRHLCGAFRDNRVVPYEGIVVGKDMDKQQQELLLAIAEQFLLYLPSKARAIRKAQIESHFDETYFSWIGDYGADDPFYYRIQSPIIIFEFDHHSGVFLTNKQEAKFHIHTIVRTPNRGDYGSALRSDTEQL